VLESLFQFFCGLFTGHLNRNVERTLKFKQWRTAVLCRRCKKILKVL